jgi:hypothetical protein
MDAANVAFDLFSAFQERETVKREERLARLEEQKEAELLAVGNNIAAQEQIEADFAAKQEQIKKEQAAADLKKARLEKGLAILNIGINTAQAVAKSVAASPLTFGLPWSAFAAALGVAQIAAVAAKPIPQFEKGTSNAPGGLSIINENGIEMVETPTGEKKMIYSDGPTMVNLQKGSRVYTANETQNMLERDHFKSIGHSYKNGSETVSGVQVVQIDRNKALESKLDTINNTIRNKKETSLNVTKEGVYVLVKRGERRTKFLDQNYK